MLHLSQFPALSPCRPKRFPHQPQTRAVRGMCRPQRGQTRNRVARRSWCTGSSSASSVCSGSPPSSVVIGHLIPRSLAPNRHPQDTKEVTRGLLRSMIQPHDTNHDYSLLLFTSEEMACAGHNTVGKAVATAYSGNRGNRGKALYLYGLCQLCQLCHDSYIARLPRHVSAINTSAPAPVNPRT